MKRTRNSVSSKSGEWKRRRRWYRSLWTVVIAPSLGGATVD